MGGLSSRPARAARDRSSRRIESDSEPSQSSSQQLSASLERSIHHAWEDNHQGQCPDDLPWMMNSNNSQAEEPEMSEFFKTGCLIGFKNKPKNKI